MIGGFTLAHDIDVYGQVRKIVGSSADVSQPPPPIGCTPASTFNIVPGAGTLTFSTGGGAVADSFVFAPNYQNYIGAAFQVARDTTGAELFIGSVIARSPAFFTASIEFSTANNPFVSNTHGIVLDTQNSRVLFHGTRVVAPCNVTNCLQLQLYGTNDSTPFLVSDITFSGLTVGQGTLGGVSDDSFFYFAQRNVSSTATTVYKFTKDAGLSFVNSVSIGNVSSVEMLDDGTNLLVVDVIGFGIVRLNKTSLTAPTTLTLTGFGGSLNTNLAYDGVNNHYYVASTSAGVTTIRQINATTGAATGVTQSIGTELLLINGIQVDLSAGKLYVGTGVSGVSSTIRRYALNTMAAEEAETGVLGISLFNMAQDFIHKRLWVSGGGSPGAVQQYTLCS